MYCISVQVQGLTPIYGHIEHQPWILPLEADLHGEGEHHVDRVDPVDVEYVDPLLHDDRLVLTLSLDLLRGGRVLEVGLGHDHLEIRRKL